MDYNTISDIITHYKVSESILDKNWVVISNGGLFIAQRLSFIYKKRIGFIDPISKKHTCEQGNVLLIDDICFSGKTLNRCKEIYPDSEILCFLYDPKNYIKPNYWIYETSDLIYFPWESREENEQCKKY